MYTVNNVLIVFYLLRNGQKNCPFRPFIFITHYATIKPRKVNNFE